jgi:hypothetical protein
MGQFTLTIQYKKNQYQVISAAEIKSLFFTNLPLVDSQGNKITDDQIDFWIRTSQEEVENLVDVKLNKQAYQETRDYVFDDWTQWGFMPTTYPAEKGLSMQGFLNTTLQVDYPLDWLSVKKTSDGESFHRTINLVPVQGSANSLTNNIVFAGVAPYIGYFGRKDIPNYWSFIYLTGFGKIPEMLMKGVALKAAINTLPLISFNVVKPGTASQSLGVDGLSQSRSTTASAKTLPLQNLIDQYQSQFDKLSDLLKKKYAGISFGVLG